MRKPLNLVTSPGATARVGVLGIVFLAWSGFAAATEIAAVQGSAFVNRGTSSTPATKGMKLETGDRVVVLEQGEVQILYNDGCVEPIASRSAVIEISSESPCAARGRLAGTKPAAAAPAVAASTASESTGSAAAAGAEGAASEEGGSTWITIAAIALPLAVALSFNKGFPSNPGPVSP